jgi:hypothetical protein
LENRENLENDGKADDVEVPRKIEQKDTKSITNNVSNNFLIFFFMVVLVIPV